MMNENRWRTIPAFPRYYVNRDGDVFDNKLYQKVPVHVWNGKPIVELISSGGSARRFDVRILVFEAFFRRLSEKEVIYNVDGDPHNNEIDNLGLRARGMTEAVSKNTSPRKVKIVETGEVFDSLSACARRLGGYQGSISAVLNGRTQSYKGFTFEYV